MFQDATEDRNDSEVATASSNTLVPFFVENKNIYLKTKYCVV